MAEPTGSEKPRPQSDEEREKNPQRAPDKSELEKNRDPDRPGTAGEREIDPWA